MKFIKVLFSILYFIAFIYIVFFATRRRLHINHRYLNLVPVRNTIHEFRMVNFSETRQVFNFFSNLFGNIALFIPLSFILIILIKFRPDRSVLLSALLLSIFIEAAQYFFHLGVADIDDILLNVLGALAGIYIYKGFKKIHPDL